MENGGKAIPPKPEEILKQVVGKEGGSRLRHIGARWGRYLPMNTGQKVGITYSAKQGERKRTEDSLRKKKSKKGNHFRIEFLTEKGNDTVLNYPDGRDFIGFLVSTNEKGGGGVFYRLRTRKKGERASFLTP